MLFCFMRIHSFISAWSRISTLMTKTQQEHIYAHYGHSRVPRIPCTKLTPTASVQSREDVLWSGPIRRRWAHSGRVPSGPRERHWDSWGKEACWARMPLVARPYNLERCMQCTARSPFQVEIQEELRPNLTGTTGEPISGQVIFPAGCQSKATGSIQM